MLTSLKKKFMRSKISKQLFIFCILISLIPLSFTGLITTSCFTKMLHKQTQVYINQMILQLSQNIDATIQQNTNLASSIRNDLQVQAHLIKLSEEPELISPSDKFRFEQILMNKYLYGFIRDITVFDQNENIIASVPYLKEPTILSYQQAKQAITEGKNWFFDSEHHLIYYVNEIYNAKSYMPIGILSICFYENIINEQISKLNFNDMGKIYVLDDTLAPLFNYPFHDTPEIEEVIRSKKNTFSWGGKRYTAFSHDVNSTGWHVLGVVSMEQLYNLSSNLIFIFLITMTITLIFSVLTSLLISQKFTRHIHILLNAFKQASDGDLNVTVDATTPNEFGQLNRHFNQMIQKLNNLIQRVYQSQLLQKQSELKALQAQITPHFLYNTLDSISWRAQLQGCNDVSAMCVALATLLRKSIGDKSPFISIAAEMEYLNSYLTIQKYRYGDRIKVLLDISPELQNFYIPKLILQPIVENSFVHAFNDSSDGYIFIKGVIQNHDIILTVKDNGSGIPAEKIASLLDSNPQNGKYSAIANVNNRIKLLLGDNYGISIQSNIGHTAIYVTIPQQTADDVKKYNLMIDNLGLS